jgi:hypothetical protein
MAGSKDPAVLFWRLSFRLRRAERIGVITLRGSRELAPWGRRDISYFAAAGGITAALRGAAESRFSKSAGSLVRSIS